MSYESDLCSLDSFAMDAFANKLSWSFTHDRVEILSNGLRSRDPVRWSLWYNISSETILSQNSINRVIYSQSWKKGSGVRYKKQNSENFIDNRCDGQKRVGGLRGKIVATKWFSTPSQKKKCLDDREPSGPNDRGSIEQYCVSVWDSSDSTQGSS